MEIEQVRKLIEELTDLMDERKLDELKIDSDGIKITLRRGARREAAPPVVVTHSGAPHAPAPTAEEPESSESDNGHVVISPMVGTFYRAPAPDADAFVEVGDEVHPDTVLCIIEAMKVMNELKAEVEGTLAAAYVENGEAVEYGQKLFVIDVQGQG